MCAQWRQSQMKGTAPATSCNEKQRETATLLRYWVCVRRRKEGDDEVRGLYTCFGDAQRFIRTEHEKQRNAGDAAACDRYYCVGVVPNQDVDDACYEDKLNDENSWFYAFGRLN